MIEPDKIMLQELIKLKRMIINNLASKGTNISTSTQAKMVVYADIFHCYIEVPEWFPVFEKGRRPRQSTKDHRLWKQIYRWMDKRGLFNSSNTRQRVIEAKQLTWFINKHGTKLYRDGGRDIYTSLLPDTIKTITTQLADYWLLKFEKTFTNTL